jgi:hypothetical protein
VLYVSDTYFSTSWAHEICSDDNEERAIVVGSMNEMAYVLQAWLPLIVWQQVEAPRYQNGYITVTFLSATLIATAFVAKYLHKRQNLQQLVDFFLQSLHNTNISSRTSLEESIIERDSTNSSSPEFVNIDAKDLKV